MTGQIPKIASLNPIVMADNRRVMLELVVENLPTLFSNVAFTMPDLSGSAPSKPPKADPDAPSPYPNVELCIFNAQRHKLATLFIIEHKEQFTSLTLHLRAVDVTDQYTARAEITYQDQTLDVAEVPFMLHQPED